MSHLPAALLPRERPGERVLYPACSWGRSQSAVDYPSGSLHFRENGYPPLKSRCWIFGFWRLSDLLTRVRVLCNDNTQHTLGSGFMNTAVSAMLVWKYRSILVFVQILQTIYFTTASISTPTPERMNKKIRVTFVAKIYALMLQLLSLCMYYIKVRLASRTPLSLASRWNFLIGFTCARVCTF